jgi:hypothetical protein
MQVVRKIFVVTCLSLVLLAAVFLFHYNNEAYVGGIMEELKQKDDLIESLVAVRFISFASDNTIVLTGNRTSKEKLQ